jgi:hypothetical protein
MPTTVSSGEFIRMRQAEKEGRCEKKMRERQRTRCTRQEEEKGSGVGIKGEKPLTAARTTEQRSTTHEEGNRIQLHGRKALVGGAYQRTADAGRERLMQHVT